MGKSPLDYFGIWMTIIGTLLSVIGTLVTLNLWNTNLGVFILIFFLVTFGMIMLYFLYKWNKYKRYYDAYPIINRAFSQANSIVNPDIKDSENLIEDFTTLQNFCSDIAEAFGTISNTQCAICIKIIVGTENNNRAWVETLVRDYNSSRKRLNKTKESKNHWLEANSDFSFIFDEQINHELANKNYKSNCLPVESQYKNSRLPKWWFSPNDVNSYADKEFPAPSYVIILFWLRKIPGIGNLANRFFWPLSYKSNIVVPIVPLNTTSLKETRLQGYLCLDSNRSNAFDLDMDTQIMMGIADGLDPSIRKIAAKYLTDNEGHA